MRMLAPISQSCKKMMFSHHSAMTHNMRLNRIQHRPDRGNSFFFAQMPKRIRLDLPHSLTRNFIFSADGLKRICALALKAKTPFQHIPHAQIRSEEHTSELQSQSN